MSLFSEDALVEQTAIALLAELGWQTASGRGETFGPSGTLGRETPSDVVLVPRLRAALQRLNPDVPTAALQHALDELTRNRAAMSLVAANREIYTLLKDGLLVSIPDPIQGGQQTTRLRLVDWDTPAHNDFLLVSQLKIAGLLQNCIPDLVGFVNGLPWVVIELKRPGVAVRQAYDGNLTHYKDQIPALFWSNALLLASNGLDSRLGSLTADWGRWVAWKRIADENEPRRVSLEVLLRGTCDPTRLLDLVENFTLFSEQKAGVAKIIAQNHQFLGVNNAIASMLAARAQGHGRGGVFWQTQGSGKSFSMVFFAQKVLRKLPGNWTFVIVTDRTELDQQIATTFKAVGAVSEAEGDQCHATSGSHLRHLLRGNHRYVFTLIHKFQTAELLADRADVVVLTDEAHRSQYDTLALNMRAALPHALFLAFTGTPLMAGEERTKEVFGDYVSIYDFQQSVEDGATVPLFYENRTPALQLTNPDLNEDIYALIEEAELDPEQEEKLEQELARQYHLLTRDDRLDVVAQDIVRHFLGRGFVGKGMVVSLDKATAVRTYHKVQTHWAAETARVQAELARWENQPWAGETAAEQDQRKERVADLQARLALLTETDMAVIVSPAQNEVAHMQQKWGLDMTPHRQRMNDSQPKLDEKFKDTADPLRLVFVCAMWLTGFDAPSCATIYLDKPMRNHTLMQTIARANRVFPGKHSGVIVDYANVFASLEQALALYGAGQPGHSPVQDKQALVVALATAVGTAAEFAQTKGVALAALEDAAVGGDERLRLLDDGVNALISPDGVRQEFMAHQRLAHTLYRAVLPDPAALAFVGRVATLAALAEAIQTKLNPSPADISAVMGQINALLDDSITGHAIREDNLPPLDLSKIDFEALGQRFRQSPHQNSALEQLKAAVRAQLEQMIALNRTRANFADKFEELIEAYNAGSATIEATYAALLKLTYHLSEEQKRHVREGFTEEELVIFDILTRPAPELSAEEKGEVKKVARALLSKMKRLLVLNWRDKSAARARLQAEIRQALDDGLPRAYTPELYQAKCAAVFEHVYESYPEGHRGVYAQG